MKKIYLWPIFLILALAMGGFIYRSVTTVDPKIEKIVQDIEENKHMSGANSTGSNYEDNIGDFQTGDIIAGEYNGTRIVYPRGINFEDYANYKIYPMDNLTQRQRIVEHVDGLYFELTSYHHNKNNNLLYVAMASGGNGILYTYDLLQHSIISERNMKNAKGEDDISMILTGENNYIHLLNIGCRGCEGDPKAESYIYNVETEKEINLGYVGDVRIASAANKVYYRNMGYKIVSCDDSYMGCENGKMQQRSATGAILEKTLP